MRNNSFEDANLDEQDRLRPDHRPAPQPEVAPKREVMRDKQDQLNVLIERGLRDRFKLQAMHDRRTMSDLVEEWIRDYLAGRR